jgi:glycolate oxidase subunit GlcD
VKQSLLRALKAVVGPDGLTADPTRRKAYECDSLAMIRRVPDLVLAPLNTQEAASCLRILAEEGLPIIPRGAGTGLSGGATPHQGGVVFKTTRMRRVLEVDEVDRFARVEAGVINVNLSSACSHHGLSYAPDPSSQQACTIGGNVANNSGGPHCFRYGATTRSIMGLVVVTPDGEVHELGGPEPDAEGYDLVGCFVGSEGMLGVATEVTCKLIPLPETSETLLALFPSLDGACDAVTELIAANLEPSAIEILDRLTIEAVEASVLAAGYSDEAEAVLLIDVDGLKEEVQATVRDIEAIARSNGAFELRTATDAGERKRLWAGRKGAFGAMGRIAPDLYVADVVVPRTRLKEIVLASTELCRARGLKVSNVFHAGDGNLHPNISYDRRDKDEVARVLDAGTEIMKACVAAGGSLSGEHGIGIEKRGEMHRVFNEDDLNAMLQMRAAWDPQRQMNPGKAIPVRGCMEVKTKPFPVAADGATS